MAPVAMTRTNTEGSRNSFTGCVTQYDVVIETEKCSNFDDKMTSRSKVVCEQSNGPLPEYEECC